MATTQKEPNKLEITPKKIYQLMQWPGRPMYGGHNHWEQLGKIAQDLNEEVEIQDAQPIFLSGWHLSGTHHGGYDYEEGEREILGPGTLLYREEMEHSKIEDGHITLSFCTIVEVWRTIINGQRKFVFLAFKYKAEDGYVGIDNHHGIDTIWKVSEIRIL